MGFTISDNQMQWLNYVNILITLLFILWNLVYYDRFDDGHFRFVIFVLRNSVTDFYSSGKRSFNKFSMVQLCMKSGGGRGKEGGGDCSLVENPQSTFSHLHNRNINKSIYQTILRDKLSRLLTDNRKCCFVTWTRSFVTHSLPFSWNKKDGEIP